MPRRLLDRRCCSMGGNEELGWRSGRKILSAGWVWCVLANRRWGFRRWGSFNTVQPLPEPNSAFVQLMREGFPRVDPTVWSFPHARDRLAARHDERDVASYVQLRGRNR
jgi:hypothetical protein